MPFWTQERSRQVKLWVIGRTGMMTWKFLKRREVGERNTRYLQGEATGMIKRKLQTKNGVSTASWGEDFKAAKGEGAGPRTLELKSNKCWQFTTKTQWTKFKDGGEAYSDVSGNKSRKV